jgi:hypothetical protein
MQVEPILRRVPPHVMEAGIWLRLGFVALSVAAAAAVELVSGEASALNALALTVAGGAGSYFAFRRSWLLVSADDEAPIEARVAASAMARATD